MEQNSTQDLLLGFFFFLGGGGWGGGENSVLMSLSTYIRCGV